MNLFDKTASLVKNVMQCNKAFITMPSLHREDQAYSRFSLFRRCREATINFVIQAQSLLAWRFRSSASSCSAAIDFITSGC